MSITEAAAIKAVRDGLEGRNVPIVHEEIRVVLAMALERDALRARVETAERDLESARGLIARLGDADALGSLNALLAHERARVAELERELEGMRQRARVAEAQRDEAVSRSHESLTESVRARADAARLREALYESAFNAARTTLASAPSAEPEGPDYSGLCSAPECGGHCGYTHAVGCEVIREYLAEHGGAPYKAPARTAHLAPSAPTPRDMRVAEAWEAFQPHLDAAEEALARGIQWDGDTMQVLYEARAVVAKALEVGT